jgi:hypothetical protein
VLPHGRAVLLLLLSSLAACGNEAAFAPDAAKPPSDAGNEVDSYSCVAQPFLSEIRDVDLLFVVATSASMSTTDADAGQGSRWEGASTAISSFVAGLGGQHFGGGMSFFPLLTPGGDGGTPVEACTGSDYSVPAVPIAPFEADGAHAAAFDAALGSRSLEGGNAMSAALAGGLDRAARAKGTSGHIVHTVLVTDGAPDPCGGGQADAVAAARDAFHTNHLETYALGIGPDAASLDPIAREGGTLHAYAALGNDAVAPALASMRDTMRRCHFYFPMVLSPSEAMRIVLAIDYETDRAQFLGMIDDGSRCGQTPGWFYDSSLGPAYATFCPAVCDELLAHPERVVSAVLSCLLGGGR